MRKHLVEFLFGPGATSRDLESPDLGERIIRMFEDADDAEREMMAVNKKPLETVLRKLGVTAKVQPDAGGAAIFFDDGEAYRDAFLAIFEPDAMHDLAVAGWVAARSGDNAMSNEPACFKIGFFEIDVAGEDASNKDTAPDLSKIAKDSNEDGSEEMDRDSDSNPVENPDNEMGDAREGVGEPSDGKDPEGKPKGSTKHESKTSGPRRRLGERSAKDIADHLLETTTTSGVPPVSEPPLAAMRPPHSIRTDRKRSVKGKPGTFRPTK